MKINKINMPLTTEQIIKIIGEGSYELGLHAGKCEVLDELHKDAKYCEQEHDIWQLTETEVIKWAKEMFNIQIK